MLLLYDVTQARQQEHTPYTQTRTGPAGRSSVLSPHSRSIAVTGSWEGQCMLV